MLYENFMDVKNTFLFSLLATILFCACMNHKVENIVIRGSDTEVNLLLVLAEEFMDKDPEVSIAVTGGGSGAGIAALINKKTDVANSSRDIKKSEAELAKLRGVDVLPIVFASDALCFVINDSINIDKLTLPQIREIYTGRIKNWKELGGPDREISLYGRQANSGTFSYVQDKILGENYSDNVMQMTGTAQILESIKNDMGGIGYSGIGYVKKENGNVMEKLKVLSISKDSISSYHSPLYDSLITSGLYPVIRPLYQFLDGKPTGKLREFLLFELSNRGLEVIQENGFYPPTPQYEVLNKQYLNDESSIHR